MKSVVPFLSVFLVSAAPAFATVTVSTPTSGQTVTSPVPYVASASSSTCAKGVASMGIYVNNNLVYVVNATSINTQLSLAAGAQHTVVEEWDRCGGASYTTINLTVRAAQGSAPTISLSANPATITAGGSSILTATATNATQVTISGSDGTRYTLPANGGTETVSPAASTTYTAIATGSTSNASASTTVTVGTQSGGGVPPVNHVVLMLQENHSFDNYFGMLNPYRHANGWNIGDDGKDYEVDGIDDKLGKSNLDDEGTAFHPFKLATTCIDDETSSWLESYGDVNRYNFLASRPINMDGFVHDAEGFAKSCAKSGVCSGNFTDLTGQRAMGYYDQTFLNYYYFMASQFAVSNRWFSPVSSKSIPNRIATFTGGTTQGLVFDPGSDDKLPQLSMNSIFQALDGAKVSWKIYYTVTDGYCQNDNDCGKSAAALYPATSFSYLSYSYQYLHENPTHGSCGGILKPSSVVGDATNSFCIDPDHIAPLSDYYTDLSNGTLPAFSFIEAGYANNDEHPGSGQSILSGQAQVAKVVNAFMESSAWKDSVFFLSYDEGGGPYDHVPPVPSHSNDYTDAALLPIPDVSRISVSPDSYAPCVPSGGKPTTHCDLSASEPGAHAGDAAAAHGFGAQLGFRVPNIVISPFTRRHYVSNNPMDHTAILKFVENRFISSTAHLTARDAAQPNLLDFFDFNAVPWATPPSPPAPVTPTSLNYDPCTPARLN